MRSSVVRGSKSSSGCATASSTPAYLRRKLKRQLLPFLVCMHVSRCSSLVRGSHNSFGPRCSPLNAPLQSCAFAALHQVFRLRFQAHVSRASDADQMRIICLNTVDLTDSKVTHSETAGSAPMSTKAVDFSVRFRASLAPTSGQCACTYSSARPRTCSARPDEHSVHNMPVCHCVERRSSMSGQGEVGLLVCRGEVCHGMEHERFLSGCQRCRAGCGRQCAALQSPPPASARKTATVDSPAGRRRPRWGRTAAHTGCPAPGRAAAAAPAN